MTNNRYDKIRESIKINKVNETQKLIEELDLRPDDRNPLLGIIANYNAIQKLILGGQLPQTHIEHLSKMNAAILFIITQLEQAEQNKEKLKLANDNVKSAKNDEKAATDKRDMYLKWLLSVIFISMLGAVVTFMCYSDKLKEKNKELEQSNKKLVALNQKLKSKAHISLLGSGSGNNFLHYKTPNIFKNSDSLLVSPIEGPSKGTFEIIKSSYQKGEDTTAVAGIIGMTAAPFDINDKYNPYYSFQIGFDTLKILFGLNEKDEKDTALTKILNKPALNSNELNWLIRSPARFDVYATDSSSATLNTYQKYAPYLKNKSVKLLPFKPSSIYDATTDTMLKRGKSWIMLGSQFYIYGAADLKKLKKTFSNYEIAPNFMYGNENPKPISLYFKMTNYEVRLKTKNGNIFDGYKLDESKNVFLKELFTELGILEELEKSDVKSLKVLDNGGFGIATKTKNAQIIKDDFTSWIH